MTERANSPANIRRAPREPPRSALVVLAKSFHDFWVFDVDPFIFGLFRLLLGLFCLFFFGMLWPSWLAYYGEGGIAVGPSEGSQPLLAPVNDDGWMWFFYSLCIIASIGLSLGISTRISTVWLWISMVVLQSQNPMVSNGEEQILGILLFFSIWLPLDASGTWKQWVDPSRRRKMLDRDEKLPVWSLRPLQVHLMLMYLLSFPLKLKSDVAWTDGTAIYYAMMARNYPRFPGMEIFAWHDAILSRVLTYGTLVIESTAPLLVWLRSFRIIATGLLLSLHLGMMLLLEGVMMFNGAAVVGLVLFLPSRRTRVFLRDHLVEPIHKKTQALMRRTPR